MPIVIKKKVSLDFLGEEYKDAYLVFQSIPLKDFDILGVEVEKAQENKKAASFILDALKKYFIEGQFPGIEKLTKDDLDGLDQETVIKCFGIFTGQELDPKAETPSTTPSSTDPDGQ